jgi:hypothetical protein
MSLNTKETCIKLPELEPSLRFDVFTAVTIKIAVSLDMTAPCGSCKNRDFSGKYRLHLQAERLLSPLGWQ